MSREIPTSYDSSIILLKKLNQSDYLLDEDLKKHAISIYEREERKVGQFRLPLAFPLLRGSLEDYIESLNDYNASYTIILIQAGSAAIGVYCKDTLVHHKVIKKYMVRKKQGKAQISYLNSKGKSRAGSRVRLAKTIEFFEEINQKLWDWNIKTETILYSCPIKLWNLVFDSKVEPFFQKDDPRLLKIPRDIQTPNFDELKRISNFAQYGHFTTIDNNVIDMLDI